MTRRCSSNSGPTTLPMGDACPPDRCSARTVFGQPNASQRCQPQRWSRIACRSGHFMVITCAYRSPDWWLLLRASPMILPLLFLNLGKKYDLTFGASTVTGRSACPKHVLSCQHSLLPLQTGVMFGGGGIGRRRGGRQFAGSIDARAAGAEVLARLWSGIASNME